MSFIQNLFRKKKDEIENVGGMEDFMTLIRVYFQAEIAGNIGITNINMLPDLAAFKRSLKVGIAEKAVARRSERTNMA